MPKVPESLFTHYRGFLFEKDAAMSWRNRLRKAALYAALVWLVLVLGVLLVKYVFHAVDRPISTVLAQTAILPLVLFGIILNAYFRAGLTHKLYRQQDHEDDGAIVRVIGVDGRQLGVFPIAEAVKMAQEAGMDLVQIAPNAEPPVMRIVDVSKYRDEQ